MFAIIGIIATLRPLVRKLAKRHLKPNFAATLHQPLTRLERLRIAADVLGTRFPPDLRQELRQLEEPLLQAEEEPGDTPTAHLPVSIDLVSIDEEADEVDLSDAAIGDEMLPLDSRPLNVAHEVARVIAKAHPGIRSFLSFENIIFILSSMLMLGGTLYFAAITWKRIPGNWHFLLLESYAIFYGILMLIAGSVTGKRFALPKVQVILCFVASMMSVFTALIAAASFSQFLPSGIMSALLATGYAFFAVRNFTSVTNRPRQTVWWFSLAVLLLATSGLFTAYSWPVPAEVFLVIAAMISCTKFVASTSPVNPLIFILAAAIPLSGMSLAVPQYIPLSYTMVGVSVTVWLAPALRKNGYAWAGIVAIIVAAASILFSYPKLGAMVTAACIGLCGLIVTSHPTRLADVESR
ncbi:MAG: hypothetical protein V3R80_14565, partial [Candidatus Tectomicrobia bacterium]